LTKNTRASWGLGLGLQRERESKAR